MSNLSPEWQAMAKLISQFYAKADAGKDKHADDTSFILFVNEIFQYNMFVMILSFIFHLCKFYYILFHNIAKKK